MELGLLVLLVGDDKLWLDDLPAVEHEENDEDGAEVVLCMLEAVVFGALEVDERVDVVDLDERAAQTEEGEQVALHDVVVLVVRDALVVLVVREAH